jgi:L-ribulokinase
MPNCALGLDFGTESVRALVVDVASGSELGTSVVPYAHGVIESILPGGTEPLPHDWALQDPGDYWSAIETAVPAALRLAEVSPEAVVGIGVDFTSCTMLPTTADGTPLCQEERWRGEPHAWVKLWKHHAAQPEAERINEVAAARGERFLARCGGKTSSEWLHAKAWQILDEAPAVYAAADRIIEAGDWIVWQLTGQERRSACQAGYKALWSAEDGYPDAGFLAALDPRLTGLNEKLGGDVQPVGARAGLLTVAAAARLGLRAGIPVGVAIIDAHSAVPAAGVAGPGTVVLILGTSACHLVLGAQGKSFPGIAGVVRDGILPGYYGFEAGQPATGDTFAWLTRAAAPAAYTQEAERRGVSLFTVLDERAANLKPGETGLLALDWWNGNRSVLMDADLSGVLLGLTLETRAEQVYRALIEGSAFGTRAILENFAANGVPVDQLYACGGLAEKNDLLMQVYADVTGRPIRLVASPQACALGAAILGAAAAGSTGGGYDDLSTAARCMGGVKEVRFDPDPAHHRRYSEIYQEWLRLHDYLGRGENPVLKRLRAWRRYEG